MATILARLTSCFIARARGKPQQGTAVLTALTVDESCAGESRVVIYPSPAPWRPWSNQAPGVKQARRRRFSPVKRFRRVRPRRPRSAGHLNDCRRSRLSKWPFLHIKQFRPGAVRSPNWQIGRRLLLITAFRAGPRWRGTAELIEIAGIIAAATLVSLCFGAIWSSMFRRNRCRRRSG